MCCHLGREPLQRSGLLSGTGAAARLRPAQSREREVEIFGRWVEGEVATELLFDPKGERVRA